jgi:hypothetical protein
VLNAVPWQVTFVALAEMLPRATDFVLERNPALVGTQDHARDANRTLTAEAAPAALTAPAEPAAIAAPEQPPAAPPMTVDDVPSADEAEAALHVPESPAPAAFEAAIEPVRRRMDRVKLSETFVRGLLREGDVLDVHEVALRWAGMPNKNERAVTTEVLDALSDAGYLRRDGERYHVVRGPD